MRYTLILQKQYATLTNDVNNSLYKVPLTRVSFEFNDPADIVKVFYQEDNGSKQLWFETTLGEFYIYNGDETLGGLDAVNYVRDSLEINPEPVTPTPVTGRYTITQYEVKSTSPLTIDSSFDIRKLIITPQSGTGSFSITIGTGTTQTYTVQTTIFLEDFLLDTTLTIAIVSGNINVLALKKTN